jgi:hypothetical protein
MPRDKQADCFAHDDLNVAVALVFRMLGRPPHEVGRQGASPFRVMPLGAELTARPGHHAQSNPDTIAGARTIATPSPGIPARRRLAGRGLEAVVALAAWCHRGRVGSKLQNRAVQVLPC